MIDHAFDQEKSHIASSGKCAANMNGNCPSKWHSALLCAFVYVLMFCGSPPFGWSQVNDGGATGTPGEVGGPCLSDMTCTPPATCFRFAEQGDKTICLFPGDLNQPGEGVCPAGNRFLQCLANDQNCQVVCLELKGFGCDSQRSWQREGSFGVVLVLFVLVWLLSIRVRSGTT